MEGCEVMPRNIFSKLSSTVTGLIEGLGLTHPTQIQSLAIPVLLEGKNALLISPTGTGKTEAAVIPIFERLLKLKSKSRRGISFLYITPLRALNRDIFKRLVEFGKKIGYKIPELIDIYAVEVEDNTTFSEHCTPQVEASIARVVQEIKKEVTPS